MDYRFSQFKILKHKLDSKYPIHIQIDLTGACNQNCTFCFFREGSRTTKKQEYIKNIGFLETDVVIRLIDELKRLGVKAVTFVGGGEPMIHRDFDKILNRIVKTRIKFGIVTNLSRLPENKLLLRKASWVRVSVDAATRRTYKIIHNPKDNFDFKKLKENIRLITGFTDVGVSFIVTTENYKEIYKAAKLFKKLGVNYIQFKPEYDLFKIKTIAMLSSKINKQIEKAAKLSDDRFNVINLMHRIKNITQPDRDFEHCYIHRYNTQIGVDGNVYPCCVLKYIKSCSFGSIYRTSFKNIWNGRKRRNFISRLKIKKCPACWYDKTNELLNYIFKEGSDHLYFV
ncbi:MAG: radical SAM protein [Candidatus Hydrogenedentota bacterium]